MQCLIYLRNKTSSRFVKKLLGIICTPYLNLKGSYIGSGARFANPPIYPHGITGIFISSGAKIGKNVVIFHQVTIGSNTLKGSKRGGAPTIGDNVYIGAGSKIIGNITIGNNCRIGANAVVVKDIPENSTVISQPVRVIIREETQCNTFQTFK